MRRPASATARANMAAAARRRWADPAYAAKMVASQRAVARTPEARARFSEKAKLAWADPEKRAARLEALRAERIKRWRGSVPGWVPESLREEFREIAALSDEIEAARRVRRLKAEMGAPA